MLEIKADENIYIDDVKLTEITIVIISSKIPGQPGFIMKTMATRILYMLGCDAYSDRDNNTYS